MRTQRFVSAALFFIVVACFAKSARAGESLNELTRGVVSENTEARVAARAALRARGQEGLDVLFETYADEIKRQLRVPSADAASDAGWMRIAEALDSVAAQRDSFASRLYWYTDFEEAKRAARATGKPILSLRLLGKLSEEYSCANSRFFRTVLYSNSSVADYLREHFILHWQTVRPAPRVTIDFGDGRKLERTVTGNSIHYVLDAEGWPVDALPGLYGPQAFLKELRRAEEGARTAARTGGAGRAQMLSMFYNSQALVLIGALRSDAVRAGIALPEEVISNSRPALPTNGSQPTALVAAPLAITKMATEVRTVRSIYYNFNPAALGRMADEATWTRLAALHLDDVRLDAASTRLLIRHNPYTGASASDKKQSATESNRLARVVRNFEQRMALDTVRNQYLLRPVLLRWLRDGAGQLDLEKLNRRVYAELFLTPDSDPWLGLLTPDTYTGLQNDGVIINN